jgi:flagellar hook-associated protein 3 FlgL
MLTSNFLYDLNNNLQNMQNIQQQMSTGNIINKASDDPLGASKVMQINTELAQNQQYKTNISGTTDWLNATNTSLDQVNSVLQRVQELLISSSDAAYGSDELKSIKDEVNQNVSQLTQVLNTSYDGQYIFGGTGTSNKPVGTSTTAGGDTTLNYLNSDGTTAATAPTTQNSSLNVEISEGVTTKYNITAKDVLQFNNNSGTAIDLRTTFQNIINDLNANPPNTNGLMTTDLSNIKDAINNNSQLLTNVGAMQNRMQAAQTENQSENTNLTDVLSKTDDVDMAQATMTYSSAQTVYMASLQTSAKILQPTLLDYL